MTRTARMLAPVATPANPIPRNPITVHRRTYSASAGTGIDVPVFDANEMEANGWLRMGTYSGPSSARPAPLDPDFSGITLIGLLYYDSTINELIKYDGTSWRDSSGAVV